MRVSLVLVSAVTLAAISTAAAQNAAPPAKAAAPAAPAAISNIVYPTAIAAKYSKESAHMARLHTCRDQYQANKASGANGGLRWLQKGGGYYSECNKRLKAAKS